MADLYPFPSTLPAERAQTARLVVRERVRAVERAGVHPHPRAELEGAPQRLRQQVAAEPLALRVGEQSEVGELDTLARMAQLVVAGAAAVDGGDPGFDAFGPVLPLGVGAAEVVGPLVRTPDVLVEPAARGAVGRLDAVDAQLAVDPRRRGGSDAGRVGELEEGADDCLWHCAGNGCTRRARTAASRRRDRSADAGRRHRE